MPHTQAKAFDWQGYDHVPSDDKAGKITCQACGQKWVVRRCWIDNPSPQCVAVLQQHKKQCQTTRVPSL